MTVLLLSSLFVVALLLLVRASERFLTFMVSGLALLLLAGLVWLAVNTGTEGGGVQSGRLQGPLTVIGLLLGTGLVLLGRVVTASLDRPSPLLSVSFRTVAPTHAGTRQAPAVPQSRKAAMSAPIVDVKFKDYEILERVGIGGMGSVYKARRLSDNRTVALKVPQDKYVADAKFVKRFYREAEVLKRFNHPNIVRVYDYRMQDPEHYIAMEYLDGESLETLLESRKLEFAEATQMIRAMADALRHIHMQNVVHRDIKPANVMVLNNAFSGGRLREGGIKLMDFGIAVGKVLTRLTMTGARVGTPIYMAPEQAKGGRVDARSDVYSLGLLAYEMVAGQTAFKGSYEAVVHQQVFEAPKPPKQIRLEVPGRLNDLILHMIEKDPTRRPTLDEVIARLDAGVMTDEAFTDPVALALSVQEKRGTLRILDLKAKLRQSLRDQGVADEAFPGAPVAITGDGMGGIYVALQDYRQGRVPMLIRKLDTSGAEVLAFGTYGMGDSELLKPVSMTFFNGYLYVLDAESCRVAVFREGEFAFSFGGIGKGSGQFDRPRVIAASPKGELFVLDMGTKEVQRFSAQGEYLSRYAFRVDRTSEALRALDGLAVDRAGAVYIADSVARKVRKIEADGTPGMSFTLEALVGEPADVPWLMSVAPTGEIFAVRQGGQVLRIFSAAGDLMTQTDMYSPVQALNVVDRVPAPVGVSA